ncbi:MAG: transposase [Patescibacteria group bacterium]
MPQNIHKRYGAYLPHWTKPGGIYAVNFRLGDSVPQKQLEQWRGERDDIVKTAKALKRELAPRERLRLMQLHTESIEQYLRSGRGVCWLKREDIAEVVADALRHFEGERYRLFAWCIMPNHVHVDVQPLGTHTLPSILQSWKGFSAWRANKLLDRTGPFWLPEYYDHLIRNADDLRYRMEYTWSNPELAGFHGWKWRWKMEERTLNAFLQSPESPWHEPEGS